MSQKKYRTVTPYDARIEQKVLILRRFFPRLRRAEPAHRGAYLVLSGNGRGFCAGLDMASMRGMAGERPGNATGSVAKQGDRPENHAQRPAYVWKRMPVPVIAAIHGVAYGGGCQIALGADIRFASPDAKMSVMEVKWGLIPDMSITQTLRDLVPLDVAKELTFTGRILTGVEAKALGLVTHVVDMHCNGQIEAARLSLLRRLVAKRWFSSARRLAVSRLRRYALAFDVTRPVE